MNDPRKQALLELLARTPSPTRRQLAGRRIAVASVSGLLLAAIVASGGQALRTQAGALGLLAAAMLAGGAVAWRAPSVTRAGPQSRTWLPVLGLGLGLALAASVDAGAANTGAAAHLTCLTMATMVGALLLAAWVAVERGSVANGARAVGAWVGLVAGAGGALAVTSHCRAPAHFAHVGLAHAGAVVVLAIVGATVASRWLALPGGRRGEGRSAQ